MILLMTVLLFGLVTAQQANDDGFNDFFVSSGGKWCGYLRGMHIKPLISNPLINFIYMFFIMVELTGEGRACIPVGLTKT